MTATSPFTRYLVRAGFKPLEYYPNVYFKNLGDREVIVYLRPPWQVRYFLNLRASQAAFFETLEDLELAIVYQSLVPTRSEPATLREETQ